MRTVRLRTIVTLSILIGVLQIAIYWMVGLVSTPSESITSPQPDTLLYCQAARRIVEGAPFSFAMGSLPSTGTTSVMYPFVLAIPYALGCTGDKLLSAGFLLNAFFYLVFVFGWVVAFWHLISDFKAKLLSSVILALFGPFIFVALSQCDIGLWMAVSGLLASAFALHCSIAVGVLLVLAPWVRPEGMVCVIAYSLITIFWKPTRKSDYFLMMLGILSMVMVFLFNYAWTGVFQFSSVAHKGYFKMLGFPAAVHRTIADAIDMAKMMMMGQSKSMPRELFFIPFLGGAFFWLGVLFHDWQCHSIRSLVVFVLASAGGFATVAMSGWQDTNYDRYLVWMMPLVIMFMSEGVLYLSSKVRGRFSRWVMPTLFILFTLVGSVMLVSDFSYRSSKGYECQEFAKTANGLMPTTASVGGWGCSGLCYYFGSRPFAHLSGIYSPEYQYAEEPERMDELRREPEKRFDYWLLMNEFGSLRMSDKGVDVFGQTVLLGPGGVELRDADWSAFDRADQFPLVMSSEYLSDRVDVGYPHDEKEHDYEVVDRFGRDSGEVILFTEDLNGKCAVDAGRLLQGGDVMNVTLMPGVDVRVVMRTTHSAHTIIRDGIENPRLYGELSDLIRMNVSVDGAIVSFAEVSVSTNGFSDVTLSIPGKFIRNARSQIGFLGDHIACGYWFFQTVQ